MYYKDITEYPKIFDCYWGQFKCDNISPTSDIIMNRNGFVMQWLPCSELTSRPLEFFFLVLWLCNP